MSISAGNPPGFVDRQEGNGYHDVADALQATCGGITRSAALAARRLLPIVTTIATSSRPAERPAEKRVPRSKALYSCPLRPCCEPSLWPPPPPPCRLLPSLAPLLLASPSLLGPLLELTVRVLNAAGRVALPRAAAAWLPSSLSCTPSAENSSMLEQMTQIQRERDRSGT